MSEERQGVLPVRFTAESKDDRLSSRAGLVLVEETLRALGVYASAAEHVQVKEKKRGLSEAEIVGGMVLALAEGATCLDDLAVMGEDKAFERMRGVAAPSPDVARKFLYGFHDDRLIEKAKAERPVGAEAYIPAESEPLRGLSQVNTDLVRAVAKSKVGLTQATVDQDATIIEAHKKEAKAHYEGGRGYQPTLAFCPELGLVVADQFRDGNVPAGMRNLEVAKRAYAALPSGIAELYFRGDSACYEDKHLKWLADPKREDGPQGPIGFTISADMSPELRAVCEAVPWTKWAPLEERVDETVEWAEVEFAPGNWPKEAWPLRYLALRLRKRQGLLFGDGKGVKYLAVVTNRRLRPEDDEKPDGPELIRWHWKKAGTIEQVHDVLKNDLAAGVMPCGRFGANAAWLRLNVLTFNVLSALKQTALPGVLSDARPKRLRLLVFNVAARLAQSGRELVAYLSASAERLAMLVEARQDLLTLAPPAG